MKYFQTSSGQWRRSPVVSAAPVWPNKLRRLIHIKPSFTFPAFGVSFNCCSNIYPGSQAVSEPEAQAVTYFVGPRAADFLCFLTIHSYSQLILVPYGQPNDTAHNYQELVCITSPPHSAYRHSNPVNADHTKKTLWCSFISRFNDVRCTVYDEKYKKNRKTSRR